MRSCESLSSGWNPRRWHLSRGLKEEERQLLAKIEGKAFKAKGTAGTPATGREGPPPAGTGTEEGVSARGVEQWSEQRKPAAILGRPNE